MARTQTDQGSDETDENWQVAVPGNGAAIAQTEDEMAEADIATRLRAVFAKAPGENVKVSLFRTDPRSRKLEWCENYSPDQIEDGAFDLVREAWGPGHYEIRAYGKKALLTRQELNIAPRPEGARIIQPAAPSRELEALAQALQTIAQGQTAILQALTNQPAPAPPPSMKEMLETMVLMRTAMGEGASKAPQQSQSAALKEMVETMRTLKEVAGEVAPKEQDDSPTALLGSLLDVVKTGLGARQSQQLQPMPMLQQPASMQDESTEENPMFKLLMQGAAAKLIGLAQSSADPKEGGQFVYETLPDEIVGFLKMPNWFEMLAQFSPELAQHRTWVEAAKARADTLFAADLADQ